MSEAAPRSGTTDRPGTTVTGRALAILAPPLQPRSGSRPEAAFVTQLIACERHLPAYRTARRREPETGGGYPSREAGAAPRLDLTV